ncbi:hypothetical protein OH809_03855 [Streptomyces sp. NBC_00873]|uniref:hypothetical protein n=1 Tax=unclassified Streptomyces TaxID=2593676 RepID=UPI0038708408|nr:hypothetical protein OH809_03855 [Streptomyces sp. NBC_00873]WTA48000.1 hypothetical protein OH821_39945 [Streptomyces sp. NBC_00842]
MTTRKFAVTAAAVGASVLAVTGITYASANGSTQAAPSVQQAATAAPSVPQAAPAVPKSVPAVPKSAPAGTLPDGDSGYGKGDGGRDDGGRDDGGRDDGGRDDGGRDDGGRDDGGRDDGGRDDGGRGYGGSDRGSDRGYDRGEDGRIQFNDRTYSAAVDGCITAASGLGSTSFSISNDSWKTVEVYRGSTCDNGSPVATVGPHGATHGVVTPTVEGGLFANNGVVGSFRVIGDHYDRW